MTWKIRHEGSPTAVEGLSQEELFGGLLEGTWEPTDEVMGPGDANWVAIENHPALAEIAEQMEPPPPRTYDDETRLDMNALIDVCLVLLVFFILTTSYAALQKRLEAPSADKNTKKDLPAISVKDAETTTILIRATQENGVPVVKLEDKAIDLDNLLGVLKRHVRETKKTTLILDHDDLVSQDIVVRIIDAAKGAGVNKIQLAVR
jgi:biopolymer transport protein ExbD